MPVALFVYACHASDENGLAEKLAMYGKRDNKFKVPLIVGVGKHDAVTCTESEGKHLTAGTVLATLNVLLRVDPSTPVNDFAKCIQAPGLLSDNDDIELYSAKVLGSTNKTVAGMFGTVYKTLKKKKPNTLMLLRCHNAQQVRLGLFHVVESCFGIVEHDERVFRVEVLVDCGEVRAVGLVCLDTLIPPRRCQCRLGAAEKWVVLEGFLCAEESVPPTT